MRRFASTIGVAALAAAPVAGLSLTMAAPAGAHDVLIGSSPEDKSTVSESPDVVELTFNGPVSNEFVQVVVLDADQTEHQQGDADIVGGTVTQPVDTLMDGAYTISYRVVSSDGHPITGTLSFTVAGSGAAEPSEPAAPSPEPTPSEPAASSEPADASPTPASAVTSADDGIGATTVVLVVAGAAVVIAGIAYLATGGRRRGQPEDTEV